jgi:diguanylate cyclase (GGDEF)-like protein/PAS domain S-box-containing protein
MPVQHLHGDQAARLVESLPDATVVVDGTAVVRWANTAAERLMGRAADEVVGTSGLDLVHPADHQLALVSLASVQAKTVGSPIELRIAAVDGWRLMEIVGAPLGDGDLVLTMRDLTQRRRWEIATDETARSRTLLHHAAGLTMLVRADGTIASASAAITRDLGHDPEAVVDRPIHDMVRAEDHAALVAGLSAAAAGCGQGAVTLEAHLLGTDDVRPFELHIVALLDDPTVEGFIVSGHDISRLRAAQEALTELANFDALTGLVNRRAFEAELEREWTLTNRDGIDSFLIVADLDGFKQLNDDHGHAAGDEALRQFAHALRLTVRETDVVGRLGGDEFAILLVRCGGEAAALGFQANLHAAVTDRGRSTGHAVAVSLGHTSLRRAVSPEAALHAADQAMYAAKRAKRLEAS